MPLADRAKISEHIPARGRRAGTRTGRPLRLLCFGLAEAAEILTPDGTAFRYPGDLTEPQLSDAWEAVDCASRILNGVVLALPGESMGLEDFNSELPRDLTVSLSRTAAVVGGAGPGGLPRLPGSDRP